jgi:hypothetical protein
MGWYQSGSSETQYGGEGGELRSSDWEKSDQEGKKLQPAKPKPKQMTQTNCAFSTIRKNERSGRATALRNRQSAKNSQAAKTAKITKADTQNKRKNRSPFLPRIRRI